MNTKLPKAWWDADIERVLCSDDLNESRNLRLRSTPVASSFAVFEPRREKGLGREESVWVLADADAFEEGLCKETVTVVCDREKIVKTLKSGGMVVGGEEMKKIVQLAEQRWQEVIAAIQKGGNS
jgi:exosome complex component RRP43